MVLVTRRYTLKRWLVMALSQQDLTSLLLGLLLGILYVTIFGLPFVSEEGNCKYSEFNSVNLNSNSKDLLQDDYEPIINLQSKPKLNPPNLHKNRNPTVVRPRYYSTELNIKDKLLVSVISPSLDSFKLYGKALNDTLVNYVDNIIYFVVDDNNKNSKVENVIFINVENDLKSISNNFLSSSNKSKAALLALNFVLEHQLKNYQYFYFVKDSTFVSGAKLQDFIRILSFSDEIYIGQVITSIQNEFQCFLEAGILLSHSVLTKVKNPESIQWCLSSQNQMSPQSKVLGNKFEDSILFGQCIFKGTNIPCSSQNKERNYISLNFSEMITQIAARRFFESEAISSYPISSYTEHMKLAKFLRQRELKSVYDKILVLESELLKMRQKAKIQNRADFWPLGVQKNFVPQNRFDVNQWIYFNRTHILLEEDFLLANRLEGINRLDIEDVLDSCKKTALKGSSNSELIDYIGGYRRFDPTRGMEYLLDFIFLEQGNLITTRYQALRPLSKTEVITVPYVTEHSRIVLVLPVWLNGLEKASQFIEEYANVCLKKKDNSVLVLLLMHNIQIQPQEKSGGDNDKEDDPFYLVKALSNNYTEKFHSSNGRIAWMSVYLKTINVNYISDLAILDLLIRKLTPDSLVLLCKSNMELRLEYLNRVRMNTIHGTQVFSPIPFVQFHPSLVVGYRNLKIKEAINNLPFIEVKSGQGRFDQENYDHISFYVFDYLTSRKALEIEIPVAKTMKDLQKSLYYKVSFPGLKEMFLKARLVHIMRAIEPDLRLYHENLECHNNIVELLETENQNFNDEKERVENCMHRNFKNIGTKSAIASILLGNQHSQNSSAKEDYSDTE